MLSFLSGRVKEKDSENAPDVAGTMDEFQLEEFDIEIASAPEKDLVHRSLFRTEVENLMNSVKQQSVEISCQFASFANWSAEIEMLSARAATLQPLLMKLLEENAAQAAALAEAARLRDASDQRTSALETEISHYRPLAARLEEELVLVKDRHGAAQTSLAALEGQFSQYQTENNELIYSLAKAESKATRAMEENMAFRQKALEHNAVIQSQMREIAELKSTISTRSRELQKQEELVADLSAKLVIAQETGNQSASTLAATLMRETQMEKELQMRLAESAEQMKEMVLRVANRDKQLNAAEAKIAGLNTKVEFLTQLSQKLREDLRGTADHTNMIESSTRQLIDSLSKRNLGHGVAEDETQVVKESRPKLRAVQASTPTNGHSAPPMRSHRAS